MSNLKGHTVADIELNRHLHLETAELETIAKRRHIMNMYDLVA